MSRPPAPIQARVPPDLGAAIEAEVKRTGASASEIIRRALLAYPPIAVRLTAHSERHVALGAYCGYCGALVATSPTIRGLGLLLDDKPPICPRCDRELEAETIAIKPNV